MVLTRLKSIRQQQQVSLAELAQRVGISRGRLYAYECGEMPSGETALKIANALDTTIAHLKGDEEMIGPQSRGGIEVCHYCGVQYHPMPRWTKGKHLIFVCDEWVHKHFNEVDPDCRAKASEDGFVLRRDLTPSR